MNKMLIGAVSLVAAVTLTACGSSSNNNASNNTSPSSTPTMSGGGGGGSGSDAVKALIKAEILKSQSGSATNPFRMNDTQAGCTAKAVVDAVGVEKLHTYGFLTADNKLTGKKFTTSRFSVADATAVVNALFSCVGDTSFTNLMTREISASLPANLPAAQRSCIESKLTVAAIKRVIIAELSGQTNAAAQLTTAIEACMAA